METRLRMFGLGLVLATALPGLSLAQGRDPAGPASTQGQDQRPGNRDAGAGRGHRMMVGHAVAMAIEGSTLQLLARDMAGNDANRLDRSSQAADRLRQLQQDARQTFEDTNKLLQQTFDAVRNDERSADWRFYNAAARYTKTLYALIGEPLAKSEQGDANVRGDRGAKGTLTPADMVSIALINHALKETIDACNLRKLTQAKGGSSAGSETLREHAKQMDSHSLRCIDKLATATANTNPAVGANDAARRDTPTVAMLAQQARDLIQMIQDERNEPGDRSR